MTDRLDAPLTARVRAAGAVMMAKTNVPPMLADWQAAMGAHFGRPVRPRQPV